MPSSRCAAREPFYPTFFVRLAREGANRRTWLRTFQGYGYQLPWRTDVTSRRLAVTVGPLPGRFVPFGCLLLSRDVSTPPPVPWGRSAAGAFPCRVSRSPLRVAVPSPARSLGEIRGLGAFLLLPRRWVAASSCLPALCPSSGGSLSGGLLPFAASADCCFRVACQPLPAPCRRVACQALPAPCRRSVAWARLSSSHVSRLPLSCRVPAHCPFSRRDPLAAAAGCPFVSRADRCSSPSESRCPARLYPSPRQWVVASRRVASRTGPLPRSLGETLLASPWEAARASSLRKGVPGWWKVWGHARLRG